MENGLQTVIGWRFIYEARDYTIDPAGRNDELILQANFRVEIEAIKSQRKWRAMRYAIPPK